MSVILINGASSSGKSALANALQGLLPRPHLVYGMDVFSGCMPPHYAFDAGAVPRRWPTEIELPRGVARASVPQHASPDPSAAQCLRDLRQSAAELVRKGHRLIVDDILRDAARVEDYLALFGDVEVTTVGLDCPLEILEAREAARADRAAGDARSTLEGIHRYCAYDLFLDTARLTPQACAQRVVAHLAGGERPQAFERMRRDGVGALAPDRAAAGGTEGDARGTRATSILAWTPEQAREMAARQPLLKPEAFKKLGEAYWLCQFSPSRARDRFFMGYRNILPAIALDQFRMYRRGERAGPIAFATWAWLSDETQQTFRRRERMLEPDDWRAGNNLWIVDVVAPFGDEAFVIDDLARTVFSGAVARWLKPRADLPGRQDVEEIVVEGVPARA